MCGSCMVWGHVCLADCMYGVWSVQGGEIWPLSVTVTVTLVGDRLEGGFLLARVFYRRVLGG